MADIIWQGKSGQITSSKPETNQKNDLHKEHSQLSNWDRDIAPILDSQSDKFKEGFNFENAKHIIRAVNGRYDNVMAKLKKDDPVAYVNFKKFTDNALAVANELKKIPSGKGNNEALHKYWKNANIFFNDVANAYSYDKGKEYAMNTDGVMLTREKYEKWDQSPKASKNKTSTSATVVVDPTLMDEIVADYETANVSSGYKKLVNIDKFWKNKGLELLQPITKSWVSVSLNNIDLKNPSADRDSAAYNMMLDMITHVGKYKTTLDPDLSQKDQNRANSLLKQLKGKDYNEKLKIIKENSNELKGMSSRMGYYGNATIYNTYKNSVIGKTEMYYPQTTNKDRSDYFNETQKDGVIDMTIKNYREFRDVNTKVRTHVKNESYGKYKEISDGLGLDLTQSQFSAAMDGLLDNKGNIVSFEKWKNNLRNAEDQSTYIGARGRLMSHPFKSMMAAGYKPKTILGQIWEQNKTTDWDDPNTYLADAIAVIGGGMSSHAAGQVMDTKYKHTKEGVDEDLIVVYNKLKRNYKKSFSDVKAKDVYESSILEHGFGDDWNRAMEFHGIDLSVDKNQRLKSTSSPKQENVNKVFNMLFDDNGNVDTETVTIFGTADIKDGLHAIQKDDLKEQRKLNEGILKNFLKGDNDHVTMTFFRHTNVPGQAAYQFYNPKTKKSIMVYAPKSKLGKNGIEEDLYTKTGNDPLDFTLNMTGELQMPIVTDFNKKPKYQSATLTYDRDHDKYIGHIKDWGPDGEIVNYDYEIDFGSAISASGAQHNFLGYLKNVYK